VWATNRWNSPSWGFHQEMGNSPLKNLKKKQDNIIPRKRTEMFDRGDQIRLPGKKRRPSSTKDIKDL